MITVAFYNGQSEVPLDEQRLGDAVRVILEDQSLSHAEISVAVVDDVTMRRLHRDYLAKDGPTDVLSFLYQRSEDGLDGEVIVNGQMASGAAARFGWTAEDELLLYVIHGTLHLVGYGDGTPEEQARMRRQERAYLGRFGLEGRDEESDVWSEGVAGETKEVS